MGWWTDLRDTAETGAVLAGNYFVPGSSLLTSKLTSEGSQKQLNSTLGQLGQLGTGGFGASEGNMANWNPDNWSLSTMGTTPDVTTTTTAPMTGAEGATQATQPIMPSTVSTGSNISPSTGVDWANAPNESAAETARLGAQDMSTTGVPVGSQSLGDIFSNAASTAGNWAAKNPISATYAAGSLYDMYAKNQMAKRQQDLYAQNRADILNTYAPGSPEYNLLKQEMERKDAAAGRNSQYGTRANELAGKIAAYKTNALAQMQTGQNALANQGLGNQFGMFNTPLTLAALTATQKPVQ